MKNTGSTVDHFKGSVLRQPSTLVLTAKLTNNEKKTHPHNNYSSNKQTKLVHKYQNQKAPVPS